MKHLFTDKTNKSSGIKHRFYKAFQKFYAAETVFDYYFLLVFQY